MRAAAAALEDAAVAADPGIERLDVLELSREVVEASRFFLPENRGVLLDPRTRLIHADARNYLHTTDELYDVIVAEPSNPWISGVSNLFTREFFHLALQRLALGGVARSWSLPGRRSPASKGSLPVSISKSSTPSE